MGTKVKKGIMKPIKYFSSMFDNKEPEMQIGFPTDVKHVAHIGWDGPNVNAPSWMNEYHSAPLSYGGAEERESSTTDTWGSQESIHGGMEESRAQATPLPCRIGSSSVDNIKEPPNGNGVAASSRPRHSRRHQSDGTLTTDSPNREASEGSRRAGRRTRKKEETNTTDSPSVQDLPAIPKQSHRRKSKGSGGSGGSTRSSRSKVPASTAMPITENDENGNISVPKLEPTKVQEEEEFL